jgi:hypothetical protein
MARFSGIRGRMAFDPEDVRHKIRRYRELHRSNTDPGAREALEQLIRELERQLDEGREPD